MFHALHHTNETAPTQARALRQCRTGTRQGQTRNAACNDESLQHRLPTRFLLPAKNRRRGAWSRHAPASLHSDHTEAASRGKSLVVRRYLKIGGRSVRTTTVRSQDAARHVGARARSVHLPSYVQLRNAHPLSTGRPERTLEAAPAGETRRGE